MNGKAERAIRILLERTRSTLIGYGDLHGKIYWIWNPRTGKIVRASAVKFNEGPDYVPDDDAKEAEYEAVFADTSVEEVEEASAKKVTKGVQFVPTLSPVYMPAEETYTPIAPAQQQSEPQAGKEKDYGPDRQQQLPSPRQTPEPRTRYIDIRYKWIIENVSQG
jgi:hypothetical protein